MQSKFAPSKERGNDALRDDRHQQQDEAPRSIERPFE